MSFRSFCMSLGLAAAFAAASLPCAAKAKTVPGPHWVGSWACSPQLVEPRNRPPAPGLAGNTLRQIVHLTIGGDQLRFKFSNEFGLTPLTLTSVHIALPAGPGAIRTGTDQALSFGGSPSITISPGAFMLSDPIHFTVAPLSDLAVTFHVDRMPQAITGHPGSRETSYLAVGDQVTHATLADPVTTEHWYVLDGIDVEAAKDAAAIAILGDSITDGHASITNKNTRWTDYLARDLGAKKKDAGISVLNQGLGGNTIIRGGLGPTALSRYDRDVIAQPGVRWVIVFEGVNDIGGSRYRPPHAPSAPPGAPAPPDVADQIIQAYHQFIVRAHTRGLLIYGATITPFGGSFYDSPLTEAAVKKVNNWIRNSGEFDAVLDFNQVLSDRHSPDKLNPAFDSGDHLHPNSDGYEKLGAAVNLKLFAR